MTARPFLPVLTLFLLAACSTPQEIRTLAGQTSPFIAATRGSVPAVERAYAAQRARTAEEMEAYSGRRQDAERESESTVLLWTLSKTDADKRSLALLERIRADDAALIAPPAPATASAQAPSLAPKVSEISKVTALLRDIEQGKAGGFDSLLRFGQAAWQELKKLEKDAEKEAESAAPAGG